MSYSETHKITLHKPAKRNLREQVITSNAVALLASVSNKSLLVAGWTFDQDTPLTSKIDQADPDHPYLFTMTVVVSYHTDGDKIPESNIFRSIVKTMATRAKGTPFGSWELATVDGQPYEPTDDDDVSDNVQDVSVGYADVEIPDGEEWSENFAHLYGLDSHITRVLKALQAAQDSNYRNRFNTALIGPPGCGKSDICESLRAALGNDAVMKLDATATTAAGAIKELVDREILPRVIVLEEIEKAPEAAMSFLLGVLDQRAEVRKTTARETIQRDTRCLAIATVNDFALFQKLQAGALSSRFPNRVFFRPPSRETLALILAREVAKVNGDPKWIAPTLDYCDDHKITDPRTVISMCLCGGTDWLTGEYQKMLDETAYEQV